MNLQTCQNQGSEVWKSVIKFVIADRLMRFASLMMEKIRDLVKIHGPPNRDIYNTAYPETESLIAQVKYVEHIPKSPTCTDALVSSAVQLALLATEERSTLF